MFYSRPKIEPLGWDLIGMPTRNGEKHFDAVTSDMRPIGFRFSGGWLTVERGPKNAAPDGPDMETVLSVPISPFGTMDIYPEQLCDILGLTVNAKKIDSAGMATGARGFDWSGRTTYWQSTHLMKDADDARTFLNELSAALPESVVVQPEWRSHGRLRCRQIKFLMDSDEVVTLGIGADRARLNNMLADEELSWDEFETFFPYSIEFSRRDRDDVTGERYIYQNGARDLALDYRIVPHRRYRIRTRYLTEDAAAQSITKTMLSIANGYFCRGLQIVSLHTGAVLDDNARDDQDENSYSRTLRDCCLERPKQFLFVGIKKIPEGEMPVDNSIFFGARPITRLKENDRATEAGKYGMVPGAVIGD